MDSGYVFVKRFSVFAEHIIYDADNESADESNDAITIIMIQQQVDICDTPSMNCNVVNAVPYVMPRKMKLSRSEFDKCQSLWSKFGSANLAQSLGIG